jgi:hypothetical protein
MHEVETNKQTNKTNNYYGYKYSIIIYI